MKTATLSSLTPHQTNDCYSATTVSGATSNFLAIPYFITAKQLLSNVEWLAQTTEVGNLLFPFYNVIWFIVQVTPLIVVAL